MALEAGDRLGGYEILERIGAGGMGTVYRARDSRLSRDVAIKVLPDALVNDEISLARFEREARAVAALSHPNILGIYDLGRDGEVVYAAMELLEGESLRERLGHGSLPVSKAVEIAGRLAKGLAAAHDKGIIHRDLKPENIFLTRDGQVKILDFGLARVAPFKEAERGESEMPTAALSAPGAMFGTIEYMSPEQLRGQTADARSDIFALGMVLQEMLSGRRPFQREALADTMTAILTKDPEPIELDRPLPTQLEHILRHCMEKRPEERFRSAHDLAFALSSVPLAASSVSAAGAMPAVGESKWKPAARYGVAALALLAAFLAGRLTVGGGTGGADSVGMMFSRLTDLPGVEQSPALFPGGAAFLFVGDATGNLDIYLQRIGGRKPINLTDDTSEDDTAPAMSPDGQTIAFRSERDGGGIFLMGATGESVRRLTDFGFDPAWSPDGEYVVVADEPTLDPLYRSSTSRLSIVQVTDGATRVLHEGDAVQPSWSPDGSRIAFWHTPKGTGQRDIATIAVSGGEPVPVTDDAQVDWNPVWSADGEYLYFSSDRGGTMNLWRIAIDQASGQIEGDFESMTTPATWSGNVAVASDAPVIAYQARDERSIVSTIQLERRAQAISGPEPFFRASRRIRYIDLSPDGRRLAFTTGGLQEDVFVVDVDGSEYRQLTDDPHRDRGAQWTPDGERISFYSNRGGRYEIWTIRPDGSGLTQLTESEKAAHGPWFPTWSPDGTQFATSDGTTTTIHNARQLSTPSTAVPLRKMGELGFMVTSWSPNGRSLAGLGYDENGLIVPGLHIYSLDTRGFQSALGNGTHPVYLGGDSRLLFWDEGGISILDMATHETTRLVDGGLPQLNQAWRTFSASRDGSRVVYVTTETMSDIWLATLQ